MRGNADAAYVPGRKADLNFSACVPAFRDGTDSPRALLERCLAVIEARESTVQAFVTLNVEPARKAADVASARYRAGRPASAVDGCPLGVKDIIETEDMPTQMNSGFFRGWRSDRDAAAVWALRRGGAVIVGKTRTTEFAMGRSDITVNPWRDGHTPGGSSSGSAAAVGAGMLPVALGTQTAGSIIRPAAYCGAYGFKPSHGALSLAGIHPLSRTLDHLGAIAGSLDDAWRICQFVSASIGGSGAVPCLPGTAELPVPRRPVRLAHLQTNGWAEAPQASREGLDALLSSLSATGIEVVDRQSDARIAALEDSLASVDAIAAAIVSYEVRWPMSLYLARDPGGLAERIVARIEAGERMTPADYAAAMAARTLLRAEVAALAETVDAFVTLSSSGPAPQGLGFTGSRVFLTPWSVVGAPAITLPLLAVDGMPQGVQVMGYVGRDHEVAAVARWIGEAARAA